MDRSSRQKINKEAVALNDTVQQLNIIDIYKTFHPKTAEYTFFSSAHGTFSRIDHMLGHKTSLNKFKRIEIISCSSSDHNSVKLRGKKCEKHKHMEAKQHTTNKTNGPMKKSKRKSENAWRQMKMETQLSKIYGMQQKQF